MICLGIILVHDELFGLAAHIILNLIKCFIYANIVYDTFINVPIFEDSVHNRDNVDSICVALYLVVIEVQQRNEYIFIN